MIRLAVRALAVVVLVLVVAVVGAIAVVLTGPTEFGFVRDRIAVTLAKNLGDDYAVDIARAVVDIDPVLGLVVRVDDITVRDSVAAVVALVPSTRFAVDPLSLFGFRVEIGQVELSGAEISFVRAEGGAVRLGNATTAYAADRSRPERPQDAVSESSGSGFPDLFAALQILDRGIEPSIAAAVGAGFERLALVNGTIYVWDAARQQQRRFPSTDLDILVDRATSALAIKFATSGYAGRWTATVDREIDASTGGHLMSVLFSQLTLADVLPGLGDERSVVVADIPLYGRANIRFDEAGLVEEASARLDLGAGIIRFGERRDTILLDEATVRLRWDIANQALIVDPSTFFFGDTRGVVTGRVTPEGDPADRRYAFDLQSPGAILAPRDSGEPPMVAQRIAASGTADFNQRLLTVDNAVIVAESASFAAAGSLGFEGKTPSLALAASFSPMTIGALKQIWVPFVAPAARRWVMEHLIEGRVVSGRFEAAVPAGMLWTGKRVPLPDDVMRLDFRVEDATFTTFGELPPITNAAANLVLSGSTFGVDLDRGEIRVPSGVVAIEAGAFAVPNTAKRPSDGVIELQLAGSAVALGEIADAKPLTALSRNEIAPSDLSGSGTASVSVRLPLRDGLTEADVDWKVVVNTNDVSSKAPVQGRLLSDANVAITATPDGIAIYGRATIDGVAADVSMSFPHGGAGARRPDERLVRLMLDDEARKRLGVGLDQVLSGTMGALVTDTTDGRGGQRYDLDMRRARLVLPGIGWSKGIGVAARLTFDLRPTDDGYDVEDLVLAGDGFGFSGSARLDAAYNLLSADIDRLALRKGDALSLKLTRGRGGYAISARGESFDLRGLIAQVRDRNDRSGGFPNLALDARFERLIGYNRETITDATLNLVSVGGENQKVVFSGSLGESQVSLGYQVLPTGTKLSASATDAGRLLRFTDLYTRMAGGKASINGEAGPTGLMLGTMELANFDVLNEPAIQQVIGSRIQQPGFAETGPNQNRVQFDRMVARFRKTDRSLAIEDALLRSPSIGATFTGRYDVSSAGISLTGTYLPAYAINNLFGRIPLIGLALGGGARGGLIGVTFKVEGPIAQPSVFINPLSAVAPGILRKIFEFQQRPIIGP